MANSKSEMDEIESLIQVDVRRQWYKIAFRNVAGQPEEIIRSIFSNFGPIKDIVCTGDEKGYRFIKFTKKEHAVEALKNMHNKQSFYTFFVPRNRKKTSEETKNEDFTFGNTTAGDKNYKGPIWECQDQLNNEKQNSRLPENKINDTCTNTAKSSTYNQDFKQTSFNKKQRCFDQQRNNFDFTPKKKEEETINKIDDNEIPNLVLEKSKKKVNIVEAQEVVVGNIAPNYSEAFLLHLFNSFDPIAITYIKQVPKSGIRYCRVYFKNFQDCKEVENRFDQYQLSGYKLIVLHIDNLMSQ